MTTNIGLNLIYKYYPVITLLIVIFLKLDKWVSPVVR